MAGGRGGDAHAAALAAALLTRARRLAEEARDCAAGLERDGAEFAELHAPSPLAEQLSGAVRDRLGGIVGNTRDLSDTLERFGALAGPPEPPDEDGPPAAEAEPHPIPLAAPPEDEPRAQEPPEAGDTRVSEGVKLLATQMSVAGSSREEIAVRLREDFGIDDADAIVAELFDDPWADS